MNDEHYITAAEAATLLGVTINTLYVYVGRKGLRSQPIPGSRSRRYWKPDILQFMATRGEWAPSAASSASALTLRTDNGPFYRGQSALTLADNASLEEIAGLLWGCDHSEVFTPTEPRAASDIGGWMEQVTRQSSVERALALIPRLEMHDKRAYDFTPHGMASTGGEIVRWMAAIVMKQSLPPCVPIHHYIANSLNLDHKHEDLVRRLLVLSADHGFEPVTYAVRAVASTGVTLWRSVMVGLMVALGRLSGYSRFSALHRLQSELLQSNDAEGVLLPYLRAGETVPGFSSTLYDGDDPRASMLMRNCTEAFYGDPRMVTVGRFTKIMHDATGIAPDFAFASSLTGFLIGLPPGDSLFHIGRSVGWIAHAREQFAEAEVEHRKARYSGVMPRPDITL